MTTRHSTKCTCPSGDGSLRWPCPKHPPAAAQEAVAWQINATSSGRGWENCTKECYDDTLRTGRYMGLPSGAKDVQVRALYAAPVTAAPVDAEELARNRYRPVPDGLIAYRVVAGDGTRSLFSGTKDACNIVARKLTEAFLDGAYVASTPAAPGIDIEHFHRAVQRICIKFDGDLPYISGIAEVLDLIDASPKGGSEAWNPIETAPKDALWLMLGIAGRNEIMLGYWSHLHQGWWGQTCANGGFKLWKFKLWKRATHWMPMPNAPMQAGDAEVQP